MSPDEGDYLLDYQQRGGVVEVLSIRHGRQQPVSLPAEPDFDYEAPPDPGDGG